MRKNLPITNREYKLSDDWMLLSITDENSTIKYANDLFCKVSGFTLEEMQGHPHNMVRHPDMPEAIFKDMWSTIKTGHPWKGIVKNRCANGDHYWVDAFITPIMHGNKISEYQSVRVKPTKEQIDRAEKTYKAMKNKSPLLHFNVSLQGQFAIFGLLALAPIFWVCLQLGGNAWLAFLLSALFIFGGGHLIFSPIKKLISHAKKIYNNSLMNYIYTGRRDDVAKVELALQMRTSEIRALLCRALDSCIQSENNAQICNEKSDELKTNRKVITTEIQQIVESMHEMTSALKSITQNCSDSAEKAINAHNQSVKGHNIVTETVEAIENMSSKLVSTSNALSELEEHSQGIGTVLDVIQGIAEQTNLLALNAAIEAARAGEQGRGFAVVADEVRALAQRTYDSTSEIKKIIHFIQQGTAKAVNFMEQGVTSANNCVDHAKQAGEALQTINEAVDPISDAAKKIANTVEKHASVSHEVNRSILNVSDIMESNTNLDEETLHLNGKVLDKIGSQKLLVTQFINNSFREK